MVKKLVRKGKVAVLYSPRHGAGWSTWSTDHAVDLAFDRDLVLLVLADKRIDAAELAKSKYPGSYTGGARDLQVEWLPKGTQFEIQEYDGYESVRIFSPTDGYIA